ncbi:ATP-binding protein [Halobaculum roseum]|uniref:ATP-binding protein n=1 Tax=Halobaculum roseum TaxID=2175149 RepID=A0ABD5MM23_9EURY|nr:ATP-binding protein [Halobaculum roseum]QZY03826.1 ATP-binding protein [Halobaculum roseum]
MPESLLKAEYRRRDFYFVRRKLNDDRRIVTIRGPRQVGKTTLCGQLIAWLVEQEGVPPEHVLYLTADNTQVMSDPDQVIRDTLETYEQYVLRETIDAVDRDVHVFIDEVQKIDGWASTLKYYIDTYPNIRFVVTGSVSTLIKQGADETLVGRRHEQQMVPMKFVDYVGYRDIDENDRRAFYEETTKLRGALMDALDSDDRVEFTGAAARFYGTNESEFPRLNQRKDEYLMKGGYPGVLDDDYREAYSKLDSDLRSTVLGDMSTVFEVQKPQKVLRLLDLLAEATTGKTSVQRLADDASIDRDTVEKYLTYLDEFFLINRVRKFSGGGFNDRAQQKVYIQDVGIYNTIRGTLAEETLGDTTAMGPILETAVCDHARRLQFYLSGRSNVDIGYRERSGEVDFVLSGREYTLPIEVKNGDSTKASLGGLKRFIDSEGVELAIVVNNSGVFESEEEIVHLPAWLFLYLC